MVESKEKCKREEKTLSATIEKGMPDGEDIVFKYESEQKPGQARTPHAPSRTLTPLTHRTDPGRCRLTMTPILTMTTYLQIPHKPAHTLTHPHTPLTHPHTPLTHPTHTLTHPLHLQIPGAGTHPLHTLTHPLHIHCRSRATWCSSSSRCPTPCSSAGSPNPIP